jgi:hypothetical protein
MRAATGTEPLRKAFEVDLIYLVEDRHHGLLSGRTGARSGLRMMPTFPPSPLSFRTAGFPQYGWKAGISDSVFPHVAQVKPAPSMPCSPCRFASAFRALRCPTLRPALCRNSVDSVAHCHSRSPLLYPRGPRSGPGSIVSAHLRLIDLIRPTRRHIPISPLGGLYGMPSLCWCA